MTYSKIHFRQIASIISQFSDEMPQTTREDMINEFSDLFRAYNSQFDEDLFVKACAPAQAASSQDLGWSYLNVKARHARSRGSGVYPQVINKCG